MKPYALFLSIVAFLVGLPQVSRAAVLLSSLASPTMQTLVGMGSSGVIVGSDTFYDFTFADTSATDPTAAQVQVEPITTDGDGLRFVAAWFADGGNTMASAITYQVNTAASSQINGVTLFSNAAIPQPDAGTFASTSLSTRSLTNMLLTPTLTTYADGTITPINTASYAFAAQTDLVITDSITIASTAGTPGGLATASVIENTFIPVPDPNQSGLFFIPTAAITATFLRRPRRGSAS
jgi:hypothetical protein